MRQAFSTTCKSEKCKKPITFIRFKDKWIPVDFKPERRYVFFAGIWHLVETYTPHHKNCPDRSRFTKKLSLKEGEKP